MDFEQGISQRKAMATGGKMADGNFGVKSFSDAMSNGKSMGSAAATTLAEKQRAAPVKMGGGKMAAQANPDHGSHGTNGKWDT